MVVSIVERSRRIAVGTAFAETSVNTTRWRHYGLLTRGKRQIIAWYRDHRTLAVAIRSLTTDRLRIGEFVGDFRLRDTHEACSLNIDQLGHIHVCYDNHADRPKYRRSLRPWDVSEWTPEAALPQMEEVRRFTYPHFVGQHVLRLIYRNGTPKLGYLELATLRSLPDQWSKPRRLVSGESRETTYGPYPIIAENGNDIAIAIVWRGRMIEGVHTEVQNEDIAILRSIDGGKNWVDGFGGDVKLPATRDTLRAVVTCRGQGLGNGGGIVFDKDGRLHLFIHHSPGGARRFLHAWESETGWQSQVLPIVLPDFSLPVKGVIPAPASKANAIAFADGIGIFYRIESSFFMTKLLAPDFRVTRTVRLADDIGYSEPLFDLRRWMNDRVLCLWVQDCVQRPWEGGGTPYLAEASLHEWTEAQLIQALS